MSNDTREIWDAERRMLGPSPVKDPGSEAAIRDMTSVMFLTPEQRAAPSPAMLGDAAENGWMDQQERPLDEHPEPYLCPDEIWDGVFGQVADIVGKRSWEVWMGTACALGAIAHRNIHTRYHGNLYGWLYGLLVSPTGTGKSVCTDVCEAILPADYCRDSNVQSGPGLAPILADIGRDGKGRVISVDTHPAIIVLPEWTALVKNLKIQNATLAQDLNQLFDGKEQWTIARSEANRQGGGRMVIPYPSLSICATTTDSMFQEEVTASMIRSGFLNRYLVLPGSYVRWRLDDAAQGADYAPLRDIASNGNPYAFGLGMPMREMYKPAAYEYFLSWGKPLFEDQLMNLNGNGSPTSDVFKRLHTYAHKIAMLYAWSDRSPLVRFADARNAQVVVETSLRYLRQLMDDATPQLSPHLAAKKSLEEDVLAQVSSGKDSLSSGKDSSKRQIVDMLKRKWGRAVVSETVDSLVKSGDLVVELGGEKGTRRILKVPS